MKNYKKYLAQTVIIVGAIMMFIGLVNGEIATVFHKAVNICMECIGIG